MNTHLVDSLTQQTSGFGRRRAVRRSDNPAPGPRPAGSLYRRWIPAMLRALTPTRVSAQPTAGPEEPPKPFPPAPIDARELSPWGPFSMRF